MGYNPNIPHLLSRWNNPLILTIDPNFQQDIQGTLDLHLWCLESKWPQKNIQTPKMRMNPKSSPRFKDEKSNIWNHLVVNQGT